MPSRHTVAMAEELSRGKTASREGHREMFERIEMDEKRMAMAEMRRRRQQQLQLQEEEEQAAAEGQALKPQGEGRRAANNTGSEGGSVGPKGGNRTLIADCMTNLGTMPLLAKEEEVQLGRKIQRAVWCERVRDHMEILSGVPPTYDQWASAVKVTTVELLTELDEADKAKSLVISSNLRLVISVAKRYKYTGSEVTNMIQDGTLGLVKAAEKFNPELGFKFSTYATWWIKQSIVQGLADQVRSMVLLLLSVPGTKKRSDLYE